MNFYAWRNSSRTAVAEDRFPDHIPEGMEALPKDQCSKWDNPDDWKKDPLVAELKKHFGCRDDYFPEKTYREVVDNMAHEYTFGSPGDTAAREKEIDACMMLVKSGRKEDIELARSFADVLMEKKGIKHDKNALLKKMRETFFQILGRQNGDSADKGYVPKVVVKVDENPADEIPAQSEHSFRMDEGGDSRKPNDAFFQKLMSDYDKAHRIYATSDLHTTDLDDLDIEDFGIVVLCGDIIRRDEEDADDSETTPGKTPTQRYENYVNDTILTFIRKHADKTFVVIPGNHDKWFGTHADEVEWPKNAHFLIDKEATVNGLRFYGTPWCRHNRNGAFEESEQELERRYDKIPQGVDVLVTHTPPSDGHNGIDYDPNNDGHFGSTALWSAIVEKKPTLVLCGHVHLGNHKPQEIGDSTVVNVAKIGTRRDERAFAGRAIGFAKDENGEVTFFMDGRDGGQISESAYAGEGVYT